jgi:hypothetical protein
MYSPRLAEDVHAPWLKPAFVLAWAAPGQWKWAACVQLRVIYGITRDAGSMLFVWVHFVPVESS